MDNSPKEFLHSVHNSLENYDSELINDVGLIEVRNISALPFNGPEEDEMIHEGTNANNTDGFTDSDMEQAIGPND